ncbi:MAG: ATP-binding protein [Rhodospirillales bacterium]
MATGRPAGKAAAFSLLPALLLLAAVSFASAIPPGAALAVAAAMIAGAAWLARSLRPASVPSRPPPVEPTAVPQAFLDQLPDPVIVLDARREIVAVNRTAKEIFGIGLLGRDLALSLRHPEVLAAVETVTAGSSPVTQEITLPAPVPRTFTLHAGMLGSDPLSPDAAPGEDLQRRDRPDDASRRVVLVLRDETRARRAERSRVDFITNASHELRSPLSALIGFIETLQGPASEDAAARDRFLAIMQAEAQRMARLVDDLMSLSRVEIDEHVLPRHRVDLADVLAAVTETLAVRAEKRQMTIALSCPTDLPPVLGETDQLTQVFHNLIDNALKYGRAGSVVGVTAALIERMPGTPAGAVRIAISDSGDGIDAIHLPRLTERFYRADESRSRRLGGTGLGLAIVKHILNRHRGQLTIHSQMGEGSTFTVFLPAQPRPVSGGATSRTVGADAKPGTVTKL